MPSSTKISTLIEEADRQRLQARFFQTEAGREPVREWIKSFDRPDMLSIGNAIAEVQWGWPIGMPLVRKLDTDLWEVRFNISDKRIARVLFTILDEEMLLLHGFVKKSQETPPEELKTAKKRLKQAQKGYL